MPCDNQIFGNLDVSTGKFVLIDKKVTYIMALGEGKSSQQTITISH